MAGQGAAGCPPLSEAARRDSKGPGVRSVPSGSVQVAGRGCTLPMRKAGAVLGPLTRRSQPTASDHLLTAHAPAHTCTYSPACTPVHHLHAHLHTAQYTHLHAHLYTTCTHLHAHLHSPVHTPAHTLARTPICTHTYMHVHMCPVLGWAPAAPVCHLVALACTAVRSAVTRSQGGAGDPMEAKDPGQPRRQGQEASQRPGESRPECEQSPL